MLIKAKFEQFKDSQNMCIGYVHPGHGWKGKQQWLNCDDDIDELYSVYSNNARKPKDIMLWCYLPTEDFSQRKRKKPSDQPASNKRSKCLQNNETKASEAQEKIEALQQKHANMYTTEQLHAWAQLVQMKKHTSLDDPPDYPFFRKKKSQKQGDQEVKPSNTTPRAGLSPVRRIHMRTECIEQLQRIGKLLEDNTISKLQYEKLQEVIMKDMEI